MPASLKHRLLRHLELLDRPAKQDTASFPPDDVVEGGEAPAGKGQNGRRTPRMVRSYRRIVAWVSFANIRSGNQEVVKRRRSKKTKSGTVLGLAAISKLVGPRMRRCSRMPTNSTQLCRIVDIRQRFGKVVHPSWGDVGAFRHRHR
jgi:hypothetical protein